MTKHAVKTISDRIGAGVICEALQVSEFAVRHARRDGRFPASWYAEIFALCAEAGIECPMSAFNFKGGGSRQEAAQ